MNKLLVEEKDFDFTKNLKIGQRVEAVSKNGEWLAGKINKIGYSYGGSGRLVDIMYDNGTSNQVSLQDIRLLKEGKC